MTTPQPSRVDLNRRQALRAIAGSAGVAVSTLWIDELLVLAQEQALHVHPAAAAAPQAATFSPKVLNAHQFRTVGTLVELIIPTTDTPGAKAALVDRFVDSVLETASDNTRTQFLSGLALLDDRSRVLFGQDFVMATSAQQNDLLTRLSNRADAVTPAEAAPGVEFFNAIKSMTITGYYSTEIGLRQELGDPGVLMSGTFEGCTHPEHQR